MKTLILYATRYGCTKKCAELLQSRIYGEVEVLPIKSARIDLGKYDQILIGASVYMGKIQKEVRNFCNRNKKKLLKKKIGFFLCCYTPNGTKGFLETLILPELLQHAVYASCVGGEMNYEKMNFLYKKLFQYLKRIREFREGFVEPQIDLEEIQKLAEKING